MNTFQTLLLAGTLGAAAMVPAHAQATTATLRIDSGTVMTSQGGEFATAGNGAVLETGSRVMLAENSSATLIYPNGCTRPLASGGVHTVSPTCTPTGARTNAGAAGTAAGVDTSGALVIVGIAAAAAAGLASKDDVTPVPPPVSR